MQLFIFFLFSFTGDSDLTQDTISTLTYLKACVKESFRMYPTASQIARLTETPMAVSGGHILPANSLVLCHTHVACHQVCRKNILLNFSCKFLNPNYFFQFEFTRLIWWFLLVLKKIVMKSWWFLLVMEK